MDTKPTLTYMFMNMLGEYFETDSFEHLPHNECSQAYGISFHGDKMVVVNNIKTGSHMPTGGTVEEGESPEETLIREIQEESNMKVLHFQPIGYQKVTDNTGVKKPFYQLRYFCIVEPYGPFIVDPAGCVTEVNEIDPKDYKKYFDWGAVGDLIINRAVELKAGYDKSLA
ncbi:MAG: NUDIX domain-containing protein [bacterium]